MMDRLTALFDRRPRTAEDWLARLGAPDVDARVEAAFLEWLEADPDNLRQYEAAKADTAALESLRGVFANDLARLTPRDGGAGARRWPRLPVVAGGLIAATLCAAIVVWPALRAGPSVERQVYRSAPTEILDVTLADGSTVTLDADSAIRVALSGDVRRVELERGAAYFDVAHAVDHPFQVSVADRQVIVTGTRFVTTLKPGGGEVSLLEGRVAVGVRDAAERDALTGAIRMSPGQRLDLTPGAPGRPEAVDVESATAWRTRRLVFHEAPLSEIVASAGRYTDRTLVIADDRLSRIRMTAVIPLVGEDRMIERMDRILPISVEETPDGRALIRAE